MPQRGGRKAPPGPAGARSPQAPLTFLGAAPTKGGAARTWAGACVLAAGFDRDTPAGFPSSRDASVSAPFMPRLGSGSLQRAGVERISSCDPGCETYGSSSPDDGIASKSTPPSDGPVSTQTHGPARQGLTPSITVRADGSHPRRLQLRAGCTFHTAKGVIHPGDPLGWLQGAGSGREQHGTPAPCSNTAPRRPLSLVPCPPSAAPASHGRCVSHTPPHSRCSSL